MFFFFNDTATTEIYTLSLHDALPISACVVLGMALGIAVGVARLSRRAWVTVPLDRKSTRLNSSHSSISYAVFCLKKKKKQHPQRYRLSHRKISARPLRRARGYQGTSL